MLIRPCGAAVSQVKMMNTTITKFTTFFELIEPRNYLSGQKSINRCELGEVTIGQQDGLTFPLNLIVEATRIKSWPSIGISM